MHRRPIGGLRERQWARLSQGRAPPAAVPRESTSSDAELGPEQRAELRFLAGTHELALRGRDEREVVVGQPLQEVGRLGDVVTVERRRRVGTERRRESLHLVAHRRPVGHRDPHVLEDVLDPRTQACQHTGIALSIDLDMQEGLALVTYLDQSVHLGAALRETRGHAVGDERDVVDHDLDDGVGRSPTVDLTRGVRNSHDHIGPARGPQRGR